MLRASSVVALQRFRQFKVSLVSLVYSLYTTKISLDKVSVLVLSV